MRRCTKRSAPEEIGRCWLGPDWSPARSPDAQGFEFAVSVPAFGDHLGECEVWLARLQREGDKADAEFFERRDDLFFGFAVPKRVLALHFGDGLDGVRTTDRGGTGTGVMLSPALRVEKLLGRDRVPYRDVMLFSCSERRLHLVFS